MRTNQNEGTEPHRPGHIFMQGAHVSNRLNHVGNMRAWGLNMHGRLHAYITGVLKNHDSPLIEINSVRLWLTLAFSLQLSHS